MPDQTPAAPVYGEWIDGKYPGDANARVMGYRNNDRVYHLWADGEEPERWRVEQQDAPSLRLGDYHETNVISGNFHYPAERQFTGLVQHRIGAGAFMSCGKLGVCGEGEVKKVGGEDFANRLVASGLHAHVAAGTPLGQPEQYKPKKAEPKPPEPTPEPQPTEEGEE